MPLFNKLTLSAEIVFCKLHILLHTIQLEQKEQKTKHPANLLSDKRFSGF